MRPVLLCVVVLCAAGWVQSPALKKDDDAARAAEAAVLARKAVEEFSLRAGEVQLVLEREPVLMWANPVVGSIHGAVFVWTADGRPQAITSAFKWFAPATHLGVEFHSLATVPITGERAGKQVWYPARGGIELKPIEGAPAPAALAAARLRQMRELANQFAATVTTPEGITHDLRLLTKPIFRDAGADAGALSDGALFVFVLGTDPEVALRIEARPDQRGEAQWHYALARMSIRALRVAHRGQAVWSAPLIALGAGSKLYDRREPFTEFTYQPGEGVNPPERTERSTNPVKKDLRLLRADERSGRLLTMPAPSHSELHVSHCR
jgi:hypothetical protein